MYWDTEITPEEEEELIIKTAEKIHAQGFDTAAILFLESTKPLAFIGGNMSRLFIGPFLPALGKQYGLTGEKLIDVFEKKKNVEKLICLIEEMAQEDEKRKKEERERKKSLKKSTEKDNTSDKRIGWRKYLPF